MPKDAKKPNLEAQSARTLYTNFSKTVIFTVKLLLSSKSLKIFIVKWLVLVSKLVYRVRALWALKLGFLASLGITRHGKMFKKYLEVLGCHSSFLTGVTP